MARAIYDAGGPGRQRLEQADSAVGQGRLLSAMLDGPAEALNRTELTQPALFAVSAALWDVRPTDLPRPVALAGHSLGEYSALYAAGALDFDTALALVVRRGQLMQEASDAAGGAMAAVIGLADDAVEAAVAKLGQGVVVANYNSPGQVVISGPKDAMAAAQEALKAAGAKRVLPLPVSGAFHSPAVAPANDALAALIREVTIHDPALPVIMNVDAHPARTADEIRQRLLVQMTSSVQWTRTVQVLRTLGAGTFVEIGSGKVLAGLVKRILPDAATINVSAPGEWMQS
jgi:[acyl-carrier-protein] S-malonyltransferase